MGEGHKLFCHLPGGSENPLRLWGKRKTLGDSSENVPDTTSPDNKCLIP